VVVAAAPRIHPRLVEELLRVDDGKVPIAEVCRRVGARADEEGLTRPSYECVRTLVHFARELQSTADPGELRRIWNASVRGGYLIALDELVRAAIDRG
jgi:hypothetical protein